MDSAEGLEGSKGWGVVSCKEMGEAPVCGVGQALKDEDIRAERGERFRPTLVSSPRRCGGSHLRSSIHRFGFLSISSFFMCMNEFSVIEKACAIRVHAFIWDYQLPAKVEVWRPPYLLASYAAGLF